MIFNFELSLKCCTSSVVKTKLNNNKVIRIEEDICVIDIEPKNKKIESRPKPKTMTDIDYDPNKEYIPDSFEFTQESNHQNSNELNNKLNEIETNLQSNSSNGDHNQIKVSFNLIYFQC